MGYKEFFPIDVDTVNVLFKCNCGEEVYSEEISVPFPNIEAEKSSDSHNSEEGLAICEYCGAEYEISVSAGFADGYVEIQNIDDEDILFIEENSTIRDEYVDSQIEAMLSSSDSFHSFEFEMENLSALNELSLDDPILEKTLRRQVFSGAITCLEDYLSTTLVNQVLNNKDHFKAFVKTFHNITNRKFGLNEIYEKLDQIEGIVKTELVDVIYHDLPKVKGMYKSTLNVELPPIEVLMKIIKTRHDMVHRNGKDKQGNEVDISKISVSHIINTVKDFVHKIEEQIKKL